MKTHVPKKTWNVRFLIFPKEREEHNRQLFFTITAVSLNTKLC